MAKRGGIIQAFRTLFRVALFALAGVLALALFLNWQRGEDVAAVVPEEPQVEDALEAADAGDVVSDAVEEQLEAAADTELPDTRPLSEDVIEEIATETGDAVEEGVVEAVEEATAEATDALDVTTETVEETVAEATDAVEETVAETTEGVADVVEETAEAASDAASDAMDAVEETAEAASDAAETPVTTIAIPGSEDTFTLVNAFRRDTGAIEVTTEQTAGGTGATLWLVRCAPLAIGTIATGETAGSLGERTDDPEMTEIPLSDPRAMIAGTACGVMR